MPTPTEEQLRSIIRKAGAAGYTPDQIQSALQGFAEPEMDPIEKLTSQFEGTGAIPTESVAPNRDVGAFTGLNKLVPSTLKDVVGGPFAGIGETFGLLPVGTRQEMREEFENARLDYLAGGDHMGFRAAVAGMAEGAANMIPIAPGGILGKKVAQKVGGGLAGRLAAGATAGATEGGVAALGETVGLPTEERLKQGALMMLAASGMGAAGGYRAAAKRAPDRDDVIRKFKDKYFSGEAPSIEKEPFWDKVSRHWFDEYRGVTRRAEGVVDTPELREVEQVLQMARTAEHTAVAPIYEQTRRFDAESTVTGEGLKDVLFDLDDEILEDLMAYGAARRNIALKDKAIMMEADPVSGRGAEGPDKPGPKVSESSVRDSIGVIEAVSDKYGVDPKTGQIPILDDRLRRFRDWSTRAILEPLQEVGVFNQGQVDAMVREGEWYVPFIRATEELNALERAEFLEPGMGFGPAPVKGKRITRGLDERKGLRVQSIFQEAAERAIRVHAFARKQKVRNMVGEMAFRFKSEFSPEVKMAEGQVPGKTFRVFRDGEVQHYFADKDLLSAIETLNPKEAPMILRAARRMTQVFRAGATLTPEFALRNVLRDQFTYGVYNKEGGLPFLGPARALIEEFAGAKGLGIGESYWDEFMASPASHATFLSGDRFDFDREISVARSRAQGGKLGRTRKLINEVKDNPLFPFQAFSQALERPGRFAEYRKARKRGATALEASLGASDVTLNFPRAGSLGKTWNSYEAFSNAMLQDISKFGRSMKEKPIKTAVKGMAYITAPSMALWAAHRDDPAYQAVPEWEKAIFLHLHQRENGKWIRVPMPPGLLGVMFSYLPRKAADYLYYKDPNAGKELAREFVEQTPLQYFPMPGDLNSLEDALIRLAPNAVQPLVEMGFNRIPFFDRPVVSERYKRLPPGEQKNEYTSNAAKFVSTFGDAVSGGNVQLSPVEVDHLISGYGAGIGRAAADLTGREAGLSKMKEDGIFWLPGLRGLQGSVPYGFKSQPVQDFYEFAAMSEEHEQGLKRQTTRQRQESYRAAHPEALYGKQVRKIRGKIREMGKQRDAIKNAQDFTDEERQEALLKIDQQITQYAVHIMESLHEAIQMDKAIAQGEASANP